MTIVTADGNHGLANSFWVPRGGGGGTWGVITSVTYRTHPSTPSLPHSSSSTPTPPLPRIRSRRSSVSPHRSSDTVTEATAVGLLISRNSLFYRPTSRRKKPELLSFRSSTSHTLKRAYRAKTTWSRSKISGHSMSSRLRGGNFILVATQRIVETDKRKQLAAELLRISGFGYL